jgi:hypothetical protein
LLVFVSRDQKSWPSKRKMCAAMNHQEGKISRTVEDIRREFQEAFQVRMLYMKSRPLFFVPQCAVCFLTKWLSQRADSVKRGWINRIEFTQLVKNSDIPLKDASMDLDALFGKCFRMAKSRRISLTSFSVPDILDINGEKNISLQTFVDNFESHIQSAKELGHILEVRTRSQTYGY